MRILFCNKYNFAFSGTEVYLFEVMDLLRAQGHEVALFSMADLRGRSGGYDEYLVPHVDFKGAGRLGRGRLAAQAIYSREARRRLRGAIAKFRPDVAHVRNIYHHLSPSILWELKEQGVPVVYHVNDFKLLCPTYNMVSHGDACERCKGGRFWHVVSEHCYQGPRGASLVLMAEAYVHKWMHTYQSCVDRFLAPSQFVRNKMVENGWDGTKVEVLPHFQRLPEAVPMAAADGPILYFGRLSAEKGVEDLLRAMQRLPQVRLKIAGDGPQRAELAAFAGRLGLANVEFAGHVEGAELGGMIAGSRFTVLPSRAYETLGKSILESYAHGRPVVASDLGSRRELVTEGETGLLYRPRDVDQLAGAIAFLHERPELAQKMGSSAREWVKGHHAPEVHYAALTTLYEELLAGTVPQDHAKPRVIGVPQKTIVRKRGMDERLRVAFIGGRGVMSRYSGIEAYYEEVGKRLAERGHKVTVYCRTYFTPPIEEHNGMQVVRLPTIRSKHGETFIHTLLSSVHASFSDCEIVHYHALGPALFSLIPRMFGKKTAVTVQGLDWQRKKWGRFASLVLRLGEKASAQLPDTTMVVSETLREHYRGRYAVETVLVPNGTIIRQPQPPSRLASWGLKPGEYVLYLGRFSPEKNCHMLIEAFEKVNTGVKLVLAGGSSYSDAYTEKLRGHENERIHILDWVSGEALDELLTHAMLFVLPSDVEGLSLALLDAMGAGVCVLTSDIPENREVVEGAGFTFRNGDVHDLERMLWLLIFDSETREMAAQSAQARVRQRYLWGKITEQIEQVYRNLLHGKKTSIPSGAAGQMATNPGKRAA